MNVLYAFCEPFPLKKARGLQVAHTTVHLADHLNQLNLAYVPISTENPHSAYGLRASRNTKYLPFSRSWPYPFSRWHSTTVFTRHLLNHLKVNPPDILYTRHLKLAAALLKKMPQLPLVYEAHEVFADTVVYRKQQFVSQMESYVMRHASGIVTNSSATAQRLQILYGSIAKLLVLQNGVVYPELCSEKSWENLEKEIIYAGSFLGWKGVDDLVKAAEFLPSNYQITLVGDSQKNLEATLPQVGAKIRILSHKPQHEVMKHLISSCIAILPNRSNIDSQFTSPIKLFEYMASGCAIVASDLPSIREVLADNEAKWFQPNNVESLANAIQSLVNDPSYSATMGRKVREKALEYTWQRRATKQAAFLYEIIGQ